MEKQVAKATISIHSLVKRETHLNEAFLYLK